MPGKAVKDFSLPSTGGGTFRLSDQRGKKLVVYFYPKDDTPGCTVEGADFRDRHREFAKAGAEVRGIERSTFVIDGDGVLAREWRAVKVPGHAEEVLNFVETL
jgi:thioredoxin-dependent peroxiredoxin